MKTGHPNEKWSYAWVNKLANEEIFISIDLNAILISGFFIQITL